MTVYNVLLVTIIVLTLLFSTEDKLKIKTQNATIDLHKMCVGLMSIILAIIAGARDVSIGSDTPLYVSRYYGFGRASWSNMFSWADDYSFEYGFSVINKLIYYLSSDYSVFLMITSIWVGTLMLACIYRYSKFPMLSLLVYFCWGFWGSSMNIMREMMVIPVMYLAIDYAKKRQFLSYIGIIILASTIHSAALIFILIYPIINIKINLKTLAATLFLSVFLGTVGFQLLGKLLSYTSFGWYFLEDKSTSGLSTLILLCLIIFMCYYLKESLRKIDENINIWILFAMIGLLSTAVGMNVGIFARVTIIFTMSFMFLFADLYLYFRKIGLGKVALPVLMALLSFYFLEIMMRDEVASSSIIPYVSSF